MEGVTIFQGLHGVCWERMCAVQLQRRLSSSIHAPCLNSVKLLAVHTVAGKLLKTVEARMMGEIAEQSLNLDFQAQKCD